jgi:hypothetical protein
MWEDNSYCWVVMCKNNWFHRRQNLFFKHRIPLAETDVYSPPPALKGKFAVRCDECHKEYLYKPSDVLKHDQELPASFTPHLLFQLDFMPHPVETTDRNAFEIARGSDSRRSERLPLGVALVVRGESAERQSFEEETFTTSVSAHGALLVLSTKVMLGQTIFLKNPRTQDEMEGRVARFGPFYGYQVQVGVDFAQPSLTFWPIVSPPNSWKSIAT